MTERLTIKFKCVCTPEEQSMDVRSRSPGEDIRAYMDYVQTQLGAWHRKRTCLSRKVEYLKLPVPDGGGLVGTVRPMPSKAVH